jgi:alkylation response protein AidB-like acyl-CoA dehydrogenase
MSAHNDVLATARGLRDLIESEADAIEAACTLTAPVVEKFRETGLFGLMLPKELGGIEADSSSILDVCEELAYADGSTGWALAQNCNTMAYAAYVSAEAGKAIADAGCAAGMFAPLGTAHRQKGGYTVSGHHSFASGSKHSDYIGASAMELVDGEMPPFDENGLPSIRCYFLPADKVELWDNWDTIGLRGTGSVDFEVPEQFVANEYTFSLFETVPTTGGAIYGFGPVVLGSVSSAGWTLGVARRAMDEITKIVEGGRARLGAATLREQQAFQNEYGKHTLNLEAARLLIHDAFGEAIAYMEKGNPCTPARINRTRAAVSHINDVCKSVTQFAYEASGSQGLRNPSLLQRCLRDMQTGGLHVIFDVRGVTDMAKGKLGLPVSIL